MSTKQTYPDFAAIEQHIQRARLERSVMLGQWIANFVVSLGRGVKSFATTMQRGLEAEADRRAIEADTFLKRSIPRY